MPASALLEKLLAPELDWLQVEVTSHCNAACLYCPHTVYRNVWASRHMQVEIFRRLLPVFGRTRLVHLQGWGEPLLHPSFFTFVQLAKAAGCAVSTTTNGMLFNDEVCSRVINSSMDLISFSLAGTGPANDYYRRGTSLSAVLRAMERLAGYRLRVGSSHPAIHVSYLLLRSAVGELSCLPELLAGTGVDAVVVSTLDFVPLPELAGESIMEAEPSVLGEVRSLMEEVAGKCGSKGIRFHYRLPGDKAGGRPCAENSLKAAYVAADGSVSPCVFTNIPVDPTAVKGEGLPALAWRKTFGNVTKETFSAIWYKKVYRAFRRGLKKGQPPYPCWACAKLSWAYKQELEKGGGN